MDDGSTLTRLRWPLAVVAVAGSSLAYHSLGTWWFEILGHQASLLLAFAILYQDYRFALADLLIQIGDGEHVPLEEPGLCQTISITVE